VKLYEVIWRQGTPQRCRWNRVIGSLTLDQARTKAAEIEKMGYHTIIHQHGIITRIGLPVGWDLTTSCEDWYPDGHGWQVHKPEWTQFEVASSAY
jgi:hypothetical protein